MTEEKELKYTTRIITSKITNKNKTASYEDKSLYLVPPKPYEVVLRELVESVPAYGWILGSRECT